MFGALAPRSPLGAPPPQCPRNAGARWARQRSPLPLGRGFPLSRPRTRLAAFASSSPPWRGLPSSVGLPPPRWESGRSARVARIPRFFIPPAVGGRGCAWWFFSVLARFACLPPSSSGRRNAPRRLEALAFLSRIPLTQFPSTPCKQGRAVAASRRHLPAAYGGTMREGLSYLFIKILKSQMLKSCLFRDYFC